MVLCGKNRGVSTRARGWAFMWRSIGVVVSVSIGGSSIISATAEDNGLALRPPMGWNPWNCWANSGDGVTEGIVMAAARVMAAKLKPSGYEYINLDCGWSTKHRDPVTGTLLVNSTRFPSGMKSLADQVPRSLLVVIILTCIRVYPRPLSTQYHRCHDIE